MVGTRFCTKHYSLWPNKHKLTVGHVELPLAGGEEKQEEAEKKEEKKSRKVTQPLHKNNLATSPKLYWSHIPHRSRDSVSPVFRICKNKLWPDIKQVFKNIFRILDFLLFSVGRYNRHQYKRK